MNGVQTKNEAHLFISEFISAKTKFYSNTSEAINSFLTQVCSSFGTYYDFRKAKLADISVFANKLSPTPT